MTIATILTIEDDRELNDAYKLILESAGYDVVASFSGKDALEKLSKSEDPSIIFLDLKMADMDGIEFLRRYNAPAHQDTTVVLFSNYDDQDKVEQAYALGAERYILKARANPNELIRIVENIIANKAKD